MENWKVKSENDCVKDFANEKYWWHIGNVVQGENVVWVVGYEIWGEEIMVNDWLLIINGQWLICVLCVFPFVFFVVNYQWTIDYK